MAILPEDHSEAKKYIDSLKAEPDKDIYFKSGNVVGLFLRVTKAGAKHWQVRYFVKTGDDWKQRKTSIGQFKAAGGGAGLTVKQAERKAEEIKVAARSGVDPVGKKEQEAKDKAETVRREKVDAMKRVTMRDLFEQWQAAKLVPNEKGQGGHKDGGEFASRWIETEILKKYGDLEVKDWGRSEFFKVVDTMKRKGHNRSANVLLSLTKQMMNFAVARTIVERNPLDGLTKNDVGGDDVERDRVLCEYENPYTHEVVPDELAQLFNKLPDSGLAEMSQTAIFLCLATCCRIGELLKARWSDVDMAAAQWRIPEENSKNGKPHLINLSDFALYHFARLHEFSGGHEWLYPARNGVGHIDPKTVTKQTTDRQRADGERLAGRSKKTDSLVLTGGKWTPHDLRRSGATLMAELGVMGAIIERCLNHVEANKVKRIYNRHSPREQMAEAWALLGKELERLSGIAPLSLIEPWQSGKVVSIGGGGR
jgi:integrase